MDDHGYGLWPLVVLNSVIFAASYFHPRSSRDRRALGGFSCPASVSPTRPGTCGRIWLGGRATLT